MAQLIAFQYGRSETSANVHMSSMPVTLDSRVVQLLVTTSSQLRPTWPWPT